MRVFIIIIALLLGATDDPSKKGRKGNENYRNELHSEAAQLYREGIEAGSEAKPGILAGLWNNLGSSLFRSGDFQQAKEAFTNAIGFARSDDEVSKFAYNTGNTIYNEASQGGAAQGPPGSLGMAPQNMAPQGAGGGEGLQEALEYYKQALLADPTNEDAKYNYEFVKRQLDEQEQNQQDQNQENQDQQENQNQENEEQQDQDQQNQDQQENQDQENQQQQEQQQQNQEQQQQQDQQEQQQQQQQQTDPTKLSREEAERILQALQNEEQELLRQVMKPQSRPKKVDKDW